MIRVNLGYTERTCKRGMETPTISYEDAMYDGEYLGSDLDRIGGPWVDFEEFPGYQIRPVTNYVVEVRKAGSRVLVRQYTDTPYFYNDGWHLYLYVNGIRRRVDMKPFWGKYGNSSTLHSFKVFCRMGKEVGRDRI